jgi:protein TonB
MYGDHEDSGPRRALAGIVTLAIHGAIGAGLIWGLASGGDPLPLPAHDARVVEIDVRPPPPPPPPAKPSRPAAKDPAGDAGKKGQPLPVEAPEAAVPLAPHPAAPVAAEGRDPTAGAADQGSGAGSATGSGTGGGGDGEGTGAPARRIAGNLRDSDYPREAEAAGLAGTVTIGFRVRTDGRVDRCTIVQSSGHALLDGLTCELFTRRYRFRPATNAAGEAIDSTLRTSFTWGTRRR